MLFWLAVMMNTANQNKNLLSIEKQEDFEQWIQRLELDDPAQFLPRLRNVVDVLVQDDWWIDRDLIQASLPIQ